MGKRKALTKKDLRANLKGMRVSSDAVDAMYDWSMKKAATKVRGAKTKAAKKRGMDIASHEYGKKVAVCSKEIAKAADRKTIKQRDVLACNRIIKE